MQRFARERGRNAATRDELDQQWLTALRIGAAAERTHSKARRVRQDLHPKTYSCTSSGAMDAEIARKGMGSTVAPIRSAANTQPSHQPHTAKPTSQLTQLNHQGGKPKFGGEKGDRTLDLRLMSPALYQLSYLAASNAVYDTIFYPLSSSRKLNFLLYPPKNQKSAALLCTFYFKIKYAGSPITPSKPSIFLKSPIFSACNLMMEYFFNSF